MQSFKERLLKIRAELLQMEKTCNEAAHTVQLDQSCIGRLSRMDAMQAQAMSVESKRRRELKLQQITSALKRIENDTFGFCIKCEDEIDPKRLKFDPASLLCIDCANKAEK